MLLNCYHCYCERVEESTLHKRDRGAEVGAEIRGRKVLRGGAETRLRRLGQEEAEGPP